jgi:hypothetical protein
VSNPTTAEIITALRCRIDDEDCTPDCKCFNCWDFRCDVANITLRLAADRLEALEQELIDERYRHDRLQDFCVAVCDELRTLKENLK